MASTPPPKPPDDPPPPAQSLALWNEAKRELGFPEGAETANENIDGVILRFAAKIWSLRHKEKQPK